MAIYLSKLSSLAKVISSSLQAAGTLQKNHVMHTTLATASQHLLDPGELDETSIRSALDRLMAQTRRGGPVLSTQSFGELGARRWLGQGGLHNIDRGVGVRAISGEKTGFAYSDEIVLPALTQAADAAKAIARSGGTGRTQVWKRSEHTPLYEPLDPITSMSEAERLALLRTADEAARAEDPRVKQVIVSIAGELRTVLVAASDGTWAGDVRPLVRMNVSVIVEDRGVANRPLPAVGPETDTLFHASRSRPQLRARGGKASVGQPGRRRRTGRNYACRARPRVARILLHEAVGHGLKGTSTERAVPLSVGASANSLPAKSARS